MMRRLVPLIVTLLSLACGNEPTSPSSSLQLPTDPALPPGVRLGSCANYARPSIYRRRS
jgi:hypothetical protein